MEKSEKEFTELKVENPYIIEEASKVIVKDEIAKVEKVQLIYQSPRLFRKSIIFKTWKLFRKESQEEPLKLNRSLRENLWWLTIMLIGFLLAYSITDKAWTKFQTNPTITSLLLNKNQMRIVYPTVSICPLEAEDVKAIKDIVKRMKVNSSEAHDVENLLRVIPNFSYGAKGLKSVILPEVVRSDIRTFLDVDPRILAFKLAKSCGDVFESCRFKNKQIDCCESLRPVYSEHGFCFAFNSKYFGTPYDDVINSKLSTVAEFDGLRLSTEMKIPSKVFINSADETLHFEQKPVTQTVIGSEIDVLISMHKTKVDEKVRDLSVQQRRCLLKDELKLSYFPDETYTFSSCMKDCRVQQSVELCECLPPFYRSESMKNETFCDIERLKCLKDEKILDISKCRHCELSCDFTMFSVENMRIENLDENKTKLNVDFEHWPMLTYHREVRFGFVDFLVAFGSILALFLSFSLLSAVELLLYLIRFIASKTCPKID